MRNKAHPTKNKGSHDNFTDIWFSSYEFTKLLAFKAQDTPRPRPCDRLPKFVGY